MREIKFRAWDDKNKQMSRPLTLTDIARIENRESWFYTSIGFEWHKLIWLQYTGLKDKSGNEIYEGDLLTSDIIYFEKNYDIKKNPVTVEYSEKLACYILKKNKKIVPIELYLNGWYPSIFTIIGNIYENKNLIPELKNDATMDM
jgi:uncharacterized phage protein (TIGR01671 family)